MNSKTLVFAFTFFLTINLSLMNSYAQDNNEIIINKLESLERDIRDVQRKIYQGKEITTNNESSETSNISSSKGIADHELRLIELEEKFRTTNGIIEELNYKIDMLEEKNKELLSKLNLINIENNEIPKISNIEENIEEQVTEEYPIYPGMANKEDNVETEENNMIDNTVSNSTVEILATMDTNTGNDQIVKNNINNDQSKNLDNKDNNIISSPKTPEQIYQRAYNMLSNGDYEAAESAFIKFIKDYADNKLSSNAYYWLGETFYVRKNYQLAAYNFAAGYKKFPEGAKAPDQLLKLGISLYSLDKSLEACSAFKKLDKDFTNLPPRISNRSKTFKEKLDCK